MFRPASALVGLILSAFLCWSCVERRDDFGDSLALDNLGSADSFDTADTLPLSDLNEVGTDTAEVDGSTDTTLDTLPDTPQDTPQDTLGDHDDDGYISTAIGGDDCDDTNDQIHPGADDAVGDLLDNNCDGLDGVDKDQDGHASLASGGDDCNDDDDAINPSIPDFRAGSCQAPLPSVATTIAFTDASVQAGIYSAVVAAPDGTLYAVSRTKSTSSQTVTLAVKPPNVPQWAIYTIFEGESLQMDVAVDATTVYVVFHDRGTTQLMLATCLLGELGNVPWTITALGEGGKYPSISLDQEGFVHISYWTGSDLAYANNRSGSFVVTLVAQHQGGTLIGNFGSMALDKDGKVHISAIFGPTKGQLAYITNRTGVWETSIIFQDPECAYSSIGVDDDLGVHISFTSNRIMHYITNAPGYWRSTRVVESDLQSSYNAISVNPKGQVFIAFQDSTNGDRLGFATTVLGGWVVDFAPGEAVGLFPSLTLDADGGAHVISTKTAQENESAMFYSRVTLACDALANDQDTDCDGVDGRDQDGDGFASWISGGFDCDDTATGQDTFPAWQSTSVDVDGNLGSYTSLATSAQGALFVTYYDSSLGDLKYAELQPAGTWALTDLDSSGNNVGMHNSVAVCPDASVHVVYWDATANDLLYQTNRSGSWQKETLVDGLLTSGVVGSYARVAVDDNCRVVVAYFDEDAKRVKVLSRTEGPWTETVLPDTHPGGKYLDLAVKDDLVLVAFQTSGLDLALGTLKEGVWSMELVDAEGNTGEGPALAITAEGRVAIAYRDATLQKLRLAVSNPGTPGSWTVSLVLDKAVARWISLTIGERGQLHILYKSGDDLFYAASPEGTTWQHEPVEDPTSGICQHDGSVDCGEYSSLVFDPTGRLHAVFFNKTAGDLVYSVRGCLGVFAN